MSTPPEAPEKEAPGQESSELAQRLSQSRVGLNPDLETSRHLFRGEAAYVIRNPLTLQSHLFGASDYQLLVRIRAERSLGEIFEELVEDEVLGQEREEHFYQFVLGLHRLGFLQLPISDEKVLYRRHEANQKAKGMQRLTSVFFMQVPLLNPDALLDRTRVIGRVLFSRWFFGLWAFLVGLGLVLAFQNRAELMQPLNQIAATGNLTMLFSVLLVLKILHEFGHAYACKAFGGQVTEMGVYLVIFTPCAYVDTSSSWSFPRKRDRLLVCLGGMYVELFFAALGMLLWAATPPGFLHNLAYNVAFLASVVTVGFNINPLMRFDGYYALSDMLEVPNLRARASERLSKLLKRLFLGLEDDRKRETFGMRAFLASFGVASAIYKITLVLGISAVIATKYFAAGLFLAGLYVGMEVFRVLKRGIALFFTSHETASVRVRAAFLGVLFLVLLPVGLCTLPIPTQVVAPAVLSAEREDVIRAERSGFLENIFAEAAHEVERGDALLVLADSDVEAAVDEARSQLQAAEIEQRAAFVENPLALAEREERVRVAREGLDRRLRERLKLLVRVPRGGKLVRLLPASDRGRFVAEGEPLATVVSGSTVVHALLNERQIERARPTIGARVLFRPVAAPFMTVGGSISRIEPMGSAIIDQTSLTSLSGGEIFVDPVKSRAQEPHFVVTVRLDSEEGVDLRHASTGRVWLAGARDPLGKLVLRSLLSFRNRLLDQG